MNQTATPPRFQRQIDPATGQPILVPVDPNAPPLAIPGSTYVPDYGQEPLGSPYYEPPPPPAWDRDVGPIDDLYGAYGAARPLPAPAPAPPPPLNDPAAAMSAFMYSVPPRAEWPLYVRSTVRR